MEKYLQDNCKFTEELGESASSTAEDITAFTKQLIKTKHPSFSSNQLKKSVNIVVNAAAKILTMKQTRFNRLNSESQDTIPTSAVRKKVERFITSSLEELMIEKNMRKPEQPRHKTPLNSTEEHKRFSNFVELPRHKHPLVITERDFGTPKVSEKKKINSKGESHLKVRKCLSYGREVKEAMKNNQRFGKVSQVTKMIEKRNAIRKRETVCDFDSEASTSALISAGPSTQQHVLVESPREQTAQEIDSISDGIRSLNVDFEF